MDTLLSVMLYLHVVASPGSYTLSQIHNLTITNNIAILAIESDPFRLDDAVTMYYQEAEAIVILDDMEH